MKISVKTCPIVGVMLSVLLTAKISFAATSLPYIGPDSHKCVVNPPALSPEDARNIKEIDGGYLNSEHCDVIYVKPPRQGIIEDVTSIETLFAGFCPMTNSLFAELQSLFADKAEMTLKVTERKNILKGVKDPSMREKAEEQLKMVQDTLNYFTALIPPTKQAIESISQHTTAATYSGNLSLGWNYLINAYQQANPKKDIRRLPIAISLVTVNMNQRPKIGQQDIFSTVNINPVVSSYIGGLKLSDLARSSDIPIPEFVKNYSGEARLMGQSASIQLSLNEIGYCPIKKNDDGNGVLRAYLAPTYTYFYPIQTKAYYKITLNKEILKNSIRNLFDDNAISFTSSEAFQKISEDSGISIEKNDGAFGKGEGDKLEEEHKTMLMKMVIDEMMARVSSRIETLYNASKYTVQVPKLTRVCHTSRHWFKKRTVCHERRFFVEVEKVNSVLFDKYLTSLVSKGGEGKVGKYINHTLVDTTTFAEEKAAERDLIWQ